MTEHVDISISREQSSALKGLLIFLVVFGHNRFFDSTFPKGCFEWLYCFHVAGFFILPWFYDTHVFSWARVAKHAKRLLWPYSYMFVFLFILNYCFTRIARLDFGLIDTYLTGDFYTLRDYTGFQYLWFLPAMFSMVVLKDVYYSVNKKSRQVLYFLGFVSFLIVWIFLYKSPYPAVINHTIAKFSLFSIMMGLAMLFLGISTRGLIERYSLPKYISIAIMAVSLAAMMIAARTAARDVVWWICRLVCPVVGFSLLLSIGALYNIQFFRKLGGVSLSVYLIHQPLNFVVCSFLQRNNMPQLISFIISFSVVLSISFFVSRLIARIDPINRVLFPAGHSRRESARN